MKTLNRHLLARILRHHARLFISIAIGLTTALFLVIVGPSIGIRSTVTQAIIGYDVGTIVYILWATYLMLNSTPKQIRARALEQDDGKIFVLILAALALTVATVAIFAELAAVKNLAGAEKYGSLMLAVVTIIASWFFTATVFGLHYAHDYYHQLQHDKDGGLVFLPSNVDPSYWDFMYFAFIINATAQTADVALSSTTMRKTCMAQSILAFFFNTSIVALAINMASGLV